MMWNWQLSALVTGAEILLFDGSVSHPAEDALWQLVSREQVTVFGTSPAYLQYCRDLGMVPRARASLSRLRAMMSTGSILHDSLYDWVRENVGELPLQSISGGTDIIGCFVLGNPTLPVVRGEAQCVSLGLDVRALMADGRFGSGPGELVCAAPFPSRPVGLFGDRDGERFHDAYFSQNPGLWTHGDLLELTPSGGARILGRSDGIMNVRGIRVGPAEIYGVLEHVPEVVEGMAVEQTAPREPGGSRIVLLVVLKPGLTLDRALTLRIKKELKTRASAAHVPAVVAQVPEVPITLNNKRSERAARDVLNGLWPKNVDALRNPGVLTVLRDHPELQVKSAPA
jgi:acetoacetyl-CoA synthetase